MNIKASSHSKNRVLVLGGYGNFGKLISEALAKSSIPIVIAGRNKDKAEQLAKILKAEYSVNIEAVYCDIGSNFSEVLDSIMPSVLINTCGPFQNSDYSIPSLCIQKRVHYIDLADGRDFVRDIITLDTAAKKNDILVVSGASSVPGLSSAVLEKYQKDFSKIHSVVYGITPGQRTQRGISTAKSILSYIGKKLKPFSGHNNCYGWQDNYVQRYPEVGLRLMANCDIPDLDLLPRKYGIDSIKFSAGMESWTIHLGMWFMSWLIRLGLPLRLDKYAEFLLRFSAFFDCFGTDNGAMHMIIDGVDKNGNKLKKKWFVIAKNGDGPHIPTIPSIILAQNLILGVEKRRGAMPCVGLVSLEDYKKELSEYVIKFYED